MEHATGSLSVSAACPHTHWAEEVGIIRDEAGYLVTGPDLIRNGHRPENWTLDRDPYYLETEPSRRVRGG